MAFAIGSFLSSAASSIGQALVGRAVGTILGGGGGGGPVRPASDLRVDIAGVGGVQRSAGGTFSLSGRSGPGTSGFTTLEAAQRALAGGSFMPSSVGPGAFDVTRTRVGFTLPALVGGIAGTLAELFFRSKQATGRPVNRQKVVDAVKHCGISLAADLFGLSEIEICQIVISRPRRRGRGISAADLRRTRSTIRKVHNIAHDLKRLSPTVRRHHK